MKQYDETEYVLMTHSNKKEFDRLVRKEIERNRVNGIIAHIIIYTVVASLVIAFIVFLINQIFF